MQQDLTIISIHALLAESDRHRSGQDTAQQYFYPRSPCGERHDCMEPGQADPSISIHALLAESDFYFRPGNGQNKTFLSTLSLRRATPADACSFTVCQYFYPRSPCGERPAAQDQGSRPARYFYPRSPCGERPAAQSTTLTKRRFLSTLSLRRATASLIKSSTDTPISIHALLAESDPLKNAITAVPQQISIHALLAESDFQAQTPVS